MEQKWWTLLAVCIATFMLLLDITIVNTALPYIERALDASFTDMQWVIDAYALGLAGLLLTGGSLADRFGRRLVFVIGLGVFTGASLVCGLAGSPLMLNAARAVQGIGGALMFATALALWRTPSARTSAARRSGSGAPPPAPRWRSGRWSAAR